MLSKWSGNLSFVFIDWEGGIHPLRDQFALASNFSLRERKCSLAYLCIISNGLFTLSTEMNRQFFTISLESEV